MIYEYIIQIGKYAFAYKVFCFFCRVKIKILNGLDNSNFDF